MLGGCLNAVLRSISNADSIIVYNNNETRKNWSKVYFTCLKMMVKHLSLLHFLCNLFVSHCLSFQEVVLTLNILRWCNKNLLYLRKSGKYQKSSQVAWNLLLLQGLKRKVCRRYLFITVSETN